MAWERRKRGGLYYTQSFREGGRVRRRYIGRCELANLVARCDELRRERREIERERLRQDRDQDAVADSQFQAYYDSVESVLTTTLVAAGYHRHNRQWRKRRGHSAQKQMPA